MAKGKQTAEQQPTTEPMSTVDVDVEHDSHGHSHTDTDRDVTVERTTDIDWTIDYGGDPVHPTSISSKGYTLPPVNQTAQPETD